MVQRIKWVERQFNFDYPLGMYPYFLERLRGMPVRIEEITGSLNEDKLNARINDNWSIKEHIGHISDLEELHQMRLNQLLENSEILVPADMTNEKTYLAEHNKPAIGSLMIDLREKRQSFISKLEQLNEYQILKSALHPRLKKHMRIIDLAYFVAEHDDHHITIIRQLAEEKK